MSSIAEFTNGVWDDEIVPVLQDYIRIPALSPAFDGDWAAHGEIDRAVDLLMAWATSRPIEGLALEVVRLPGRTPVILGEIPAFGGGTDDDPVLLYGHLDKQPEMTGWREGLGPWTPVLDGDLLYGRGGADDGYAMFGALTAIEAVQRAGGQHNRCVLLIEGSEESGSPDLPTYVDALADRIGSPSLVVCLDSGAANYRQLWATTSLRGVINGALRVDITTEGLHSGGAGGVVPSSFRIARGLLDRIEDVATGAILIEAANTEIPGPRVAQAEAMAKVVTVVRSIPVVEGVDLATKPTAELVLDKTWRPALELVGIDGVPAVADGGNVLRPFTRLGLSMRVPPNADVDTVVAEMTEKLTTDVPYGAHATFELDQAADGWSAPIAEPWLESATEAASQEHFGAPAGYMGEGGSIPFMGMLGEKFPAAQFLVIGVLGPGSNAHGPNEFLHIPMGKRLTAGVADVLARHASRR